MRRFLIAILLSVPLCAVAQENRSDTLAAAVKVSGRPAPVTSVRYPIDPSTLHKVSSPMGEGDVIKFVQTLPGISMGAEGSSAIYARGGNIGNNLITLDGAAIYSSSHLMGLSTAFSPYVIEKTDFYIGGFLSEDGNLTASHIRMTSKDGDFTEVSGEASVSNFLISGGVSAPVVKDKLSLIGAFRISPVGLEYKAARDFINRYQSAFTDIGATVYDAFAKLKYRVSGDCDLSLSYFLTSDGYVFGKPGDNTDRIGWSNSIVNFQMDRREPGGLEWKMNLIYNGNVSHQSQETRPNGTYNRLEVRSRIDEVTMSTQAKVRTSEKCCLELGLKSRLGYLNPGTSRKYAGTSTEDAVDLPMAAIGYKSFINTLNFQAEWGDAPRYDLRLSGRANLFFARVGKGLQLIANPEFSLMYRHNWNEHLGWNATLDYLTQYYHTLEGIPLGWSLDFIVPADRMNRPEHSAQAYLGLFGDFGQHHVSGGGYFKYMQNLVFYSDARDFFSTSLSGWHENIEVGDGMSYGAEFLYEKTGRRLSWKAAYTWSVTDRHFDMVNNGKRFPAKFDRRHIFNLSADAVLMERGKLSLSFNTLFTYQSGHWETVQDGMVAGWKIFDNDEVVVAPFATSFNNYKMPDYIRWDNSFELDIRGDNVSHTIKLGVYNTLNKHNPFMVYYNTDRSCWETLSLIPVLPSIYYRITFK